MLCTPDHAEELADLFVAHRWTENVEENCVGMALNGGRRISLSLPKTSVDRIDGLKEDFEATSDNEVVRTCVRVAEDVVAKTKDGYQFYIQKPGGEPLPWVPFLQVYKP